MLLLNKNLTNMKNLNLFINESVEREKSINESSIKGLDKLDKWLLKPNTRLIKKVMADVIGDGDTSMISKYDVKDMIQILSLFSKFLKKEGELDMGEFVPYVVDNIESDVVDEEIMMDYTDAIMALWDEITKAPWPKG